MNTELKYTATGKRIAGKHRLDHAGYCTNNAYNCLPTF